MANEKIRILLLGDELGQGEALTKALEKEGHQVQHCLRPDEALTALAKQKFDYVIADCMLQGSVSGVDFVMNVKQGNPRSGMKFILMSGIFTDKDFIKDAMTRTKALSFVEKKSPFDAAPVLALIAPDEGKGEAAPVRKTLYQIFAKEKVSQREKRKIIESLEEVSGFDLPFIYSLLVETDSSGYLNIYEKNGSVSGISFSQGQIVGVDVEDRTTYLGEMLIQSGYALPHHVQEALAERTNQKIGLRLLRANQLSPHAFDLILMEQMNIRLSRTISDQTIRINFAAADVEASQPSIDSDRLQYYLHDWIASKVTTGWLKSLYMLWAGNVITVSPAFREDHPVLEMALVKTLHGFLSRIRQGVTLTQLLEDKQNPEAAIYKGLHLLLSKGLIMFGPKSAFKTDIEQHAALRKIWSDVQGKTPIQIIDFLGPENLDEMGLASLLGPQPKDASSPTMTLWKNLRVKLTEAYQVSLDSGFREKSYTEAVGKEAESKLQASKRMEEARQKLAIGQFSVAAELLHEVQRTHPQLEHLHILMAWAKVGQSEGGKKTNLLKEVEFELVQVPAEERYDAHYPLVMGLFQRAKGDTMGAKKQLERAIAMNPSLIPARRELSTIESQLKKEKDIFANVDLKGFVGGLFKRR
ncbi:MAG: response regulator [Bdellovibrionaceae bacterium]|nr:response regulator [Pseudobdellovibrionaceae bacterium]